jgi:hypothetical protein
MLLATTPGVAKIFLLATGGAIFAIVLYVFSLLGTGISGK